MTAATTGDLERLLDRARQHIAAKVEADGPDAHQVEIDQLVWCHAHAQAAGALGDWAAISGNPTAAGLAQVAWADAVALAAGRDFSASVERLKKLAGLAAQIEGLEYAGASEEHTLLRHSLRQLAESEIKPLAGKLHREDLDVPESIIEAVSEFGLFGLSIPTAYGGTQEGADSTAMLIATEELSRASLAAGGSLITRPEIMVRALLRGGTEDQKRRLLPAIAKGQQLVAVAVTEPDHGSNVADITCRAKATPTGDWEITGTKLWCTFAGRADLIMLLARTGSTGRKGLSAFAVEKPAFKGHAFEYDQPGGGRLTGRAIPTIGYRGMHTFELRFDRFIVPSDSLIGGEEWLNRGFYLQLEGFALGRIQTAGRAVGLMQAALEDSVQYATSREVFGRPIIANQLAQAKLGEMSCKLQSSRQLSYRACGMLDRGDSDGQVAASLAKLFASRMAESVSRDAAQLHGAMGYSEETDVSRYFVDARVLPVFEGAEEILSLRVIGPTLLRGSN